MGSRFVRRRVLCTSKSNSNGGILLNFCSQFVGEREAHFGAANTEGLMLEN
jgi:hypothetical protein